MNLIKYMGTVGKELIDLPMLSKFYMAALAVVCFIISISWGDPWYATLSTVSGVLCVVLVAERKISNYFWGVINCVLYGYLSYQNRFYGDMALNWVIYLPFQFIGMHLWSKQMNTNNEVITRSLSDKQRLLGSISVLFIIYGTGAVLSHFGGQSPYTDASNTIWSIAATILMAKCYREQWFCWIVVNLTGIAMWGIATYNNGGAGVAGLIMWLAFLVNSLYGYVQWSKQEKKIRTGGGCLI